MKYIRTKDSVYEVKVNEEYKSRNVTNYFYYTDKETGINMLCDKKELRKYKQADTIEELCDEFVLHYGDTIQTKIPIPWATYERRDDNWQKHKEKLISELKKTERKAIVYGAIWIDKGLIYVAKMNDKGVLELL